MALDFTSVINVTKNYVNEVRRIYPVDKAVLYGSYAKGTADKHHSDIDICFFLDNYAGKERMDILVELLGIKRKYKNAYFEPTVFPTSELENDNPFVKEIMRTDKEKKKKNCEKRPHCT
jgi:predicted nucleotidyltransferase